MFHCKKKICEGIQIYLSGKGFMSVCKGDGKLPQPGVLLPMICSVSKNGPINKEKKKTFFFLNKENRTERWLC